MIDHLNVLAVKSQRPVLDQDNTLGYRCSKWFYVVDLCKVDAMLHGGSHDIHDIEDKERGVPRNIGISFSGLIWVFRYAHYVLLRSVMFCDSGEDIARILSCYERQALTFRNVFYVQIYHFQQVLFGLEPRPRNWVTSTHSNDTDCRMSYNKSFCCVFRILPQYENYLVS